MHCNLRPSHITPVVLGFNLHNHDAAPAYQFNNSTNDILAIGVFGQICTAPAQKLHNRH